MVVSDNENELGQIDLDGVLAIILTSRGASLTSSLISEAGDELCSVLLRVLLRLDHGLLRDAELAIDPAECFT